LRCPGGCAFEGQYLDELLTQRTTFRPVAIEKPSRAALHNFRLLWDSFNRKYLEIVK